MKKKEAKVMRSFQIKMITQLERGEFTSVTLKNDIFVKWLVGYMTDTNKPFKIIDMGSGVKKITLEGIVCPQCGGKGFLHGNFGTLPDTDR